MTGNGIATRRLLAATLLLLSTTALIAALPAFAQDPAEPLYEFQPPAPWIDVAAPDYDAPLPANGVADGAWHLLYDRQINVTDDGDDLYTHYVVKVLNSVGVDEQSQINFSVDPSYQSLRIHTLRIVRDGAVVDQRDLSRVTALPEETERRNRVYNGRYNIDVLLSDVRIGDIIEYSHTLVSREQLFPGHFSTRLSTAWSAPLHRQRIRIRSPVERPLRYRLSNSETVPAAGIAGNVREFVLDRTGIAAVVADADRPGWYETWPFLEVSDLESWSEAARLVEPLFAARPRTSTRVAEVVSEVLAAGGTAEEQALRALQYVQEEIRYTSIAIGRGSHEPADPDVVLQRRFGDCKDKSLLLVTILGQLGIEAQTALVNTSRGRALDRSFPTPYAFDHAIVRASIGNGVYWLDATSSTRYSPISTRDPANFERALLTNGGGPELEVIPRPASDTRQREVSMVFDLTAGIDQPATLEMTTWVRGAQADSTRRSIARGSPEQRQSDYTNYTARYYPGVRSTGPVEISDDTSGNVIEIREHYALDRTFTEDDDGSLSFFLHADELYTYGERLSASVREAPLSLDYPVHVRQNIVVHLPDDWSIEPATLKIENPSFRYESSVRYSQRALELSYAYEALSDHVEVEALPRFERDRARFYDDAGYLLWNNARSPSGLSYAPAPVIAMLLALILSAWWCLRRGWRYDPPPGTTAADAPAGIRGWLLVPALAAALAPLVYAVVVAAWMPFISEDLWSTLPDIVAKDHAGSVQFVMAVLLSTGVAMLVGSVLMAALFFKKRTSAPRAFITWSWIAVTWGVLVLGWAMLSELSAETTLAEFVRETVRDVLGILIWTAYMLTSKRVRATFVNRLRRDDTALAGAPRITALAAPVSAP